MDLKCIYCQKEYPSKRSYSQHIIRCPLNKNRIKIYSDNIKKYNNLPKEKKTIRNGYTKAKEQGRIYIISKETRKKLGEASHKRVWSDESRLKLSLSMKLAVQKYPESYNKNNVCGRVKNITYLSRTGEEIILKGSWEYMVAKFLDDNNISWTNNIHPFEYVYNDTKHFYFPDFYLYDYDIYLEVKGYKRDKDIAKWNNFPKLLVVLEKREIELIKKNEFSIENLINAK